MTTRQKIKQELAQVPDGLSKTELQKRVGGNPGVFRQQLAYLIGAGDISVEEEEREYGLTRIHRLAEARYGTA